MSDSPEARIAALAARQHGVVTRRQLLAAGLTARQVDGRLRTGRLRRVHRGVYLPGAFVGSAEPPRAVVMAAQLASGPGSLISHRHAAALRDLLAEPPRSAPVHVLVPDGRTPVRRPGIVAHEAAGLRPEDAMTVDGVPVTSTLRTLADLAGSVSSRDLERAVSRAERARLVSDEDLRGLVARHRGRPGARLLRAVVLRDGGAKLTRSEAEGRFLELVRGTGLPEPQVNVLVHGYEVDFYWEAAAVVVEIDGFAFHRSRPSFRTDHRRDTRLFSQAGIRVLRFTWEQVVDEPKPTLVALVRALDRS